LNRRRLLAAPLVLLALTCVALASAAGAGAAPLQWCGTGEPSTDLPDAVSAIEWHIVYAIPAGGQDRFGYFAPRIAGDVAAVSNWWVGQDATRRPRYDVIDAPGCPTEFQRVDISVAHLPHTNAEESARQIEADLEAQGFSSEDKGYLVYYDGSLNTSDEYGICGQGGVADGPWAYSILYLQACFQVTSDDYRSETAAHEMVHGMGAVTSKAPHYCDGGHVCDSPNDLMKAIANEGDTLGSAALDVGRDDYYGHTGAWYDVQDSGLLYRLDLTLPPAPPVTATATSVGSAVQVKWHATPPESGIYYRVYGTDGKLIQTEPSTSITANGEVGQTLTWTIRTEDNGGFLGPATTLRFKVGFGIVDASGALLHDTVAPGGVSGLSAKRSGAQVVVRWQAVADPLGLRGYRISAPGMRAVVVKATTTRLPLSGVKGKTLSVAAVDLAGNVGTAVTVRVPR
jgi:hypothetical protein